MIRVAAQTVACALLLSAPLAQAADAPVPPPPPSAPARPAPAPAAAKAAAAPKAITLDYKGTLHDGLKKIASQGGLNLVITGELNDPAEIILNQAMPEEALSTVAHAHNLKVTHQGSIWTLRPMTLSEKAAGADSDNDDTPTPAEQSEAESEAEQARNEAQEEAREAAREAEEQAREAADEAREAARDQAEALRDQVKSDVLQRLFHDASGRNNLAGTGSLTVQQGQTFDDVVSYGGGLKIDGHVKNDAVAYGGSIALGPHAEVDGNVVTFGGKVDRAPGAKVRGDVVAIGSAAVGKDVAEIARRAHDHDSDDSEGRSHHGFQLPSFLLWFAVLFGIGFGASMFFPDRMKVIEAELHRDPLRCGITGLVGTLGLLPATIALILTCIGIFFVPVLYLVAAAASMVGFSALAKDIGTRLPLPANRKTQAIVLALGSLILLAVGFIPVLGPISLIIVGFLSFGVVLRTRFGTRRLGFPEPV